MKVFVAKNLFGVFALDEGGRLLDQEPFPREAEAVAERMEASREGLLEEERRLLDRWRGSEIRLEKEKEVPGLRVEVPNPAGEALRRDPVQFVGEEERALYPSLLREVLFHLGRERLRKASARRDRPLMEAIKGMGDLEEALNLLTEREREWKEALYPPQAAGEALPSPGDPLLALGEEVQKLKKLRSLLEEYLDAQMEEVAPNLRALIGPLLGAKLISEAKGLEPLARMPGSRIQVLGARKALLRHLREGSPPPKYGLLFQHPWIKKAPWWQRGKIARSLAAKVAIAARLDAYSGEFLGDRLAADVQRRVGEVQAAYPREPERLRILPRPPEERRKRRKKKGGKRRGKR
jgi:nucleolar protein 56